MNNFLYFSFIQGVFAFFAPCAVAILPAYIFSFVSKNTQEKQKAKLLLRALKLAFLSVLGILVIYAIAGGLILVASQLVKEYMKWIALGLGVILIILGILIFIGKNISLQLHIRSTGYKNETVEAFIFGVAYAIGALGCLFPLFLVVTTQALTAPTIAIGASYIIAYFAGMSLLMVTTILLATFAKEFLLKQINWILPHMHRITGVLLVVAGIYIIQYQLVLF